MINDTHEEFKKRMIEKGEKQVKKIVKKKGKKKTITDPKSFQDPYQVSRHGEIMASPYIIVENYKDGKFVSFELE